MEAGHITAQGAGLTGAQPAAFLDAGIASIPQSPKDEGVAPGLTVLEHLAYDGLPQRAKGVQVDWEALRGDFARIPASRSQ